MSHASSITVQRKKELYIPRAGGQIGNAGRGSKIFSLEAQARFLKKLASGEHNVQSAAEAVGFQRSTVYRQIDRSERFAREFKRAYHKSMQGLEDRLQGMAIGMPVRGNITAIFGLLRANMPEKYRENMKLSVGAEGDFAALLRGMAAHLPPVGERDVTPVKPALEHDAKSAKE